jgi:Uncharacterized protein conserved in bacteria
VAGPRIWVDADACPRPVRDVVCRAAERRQVPTIFVAASPLNLPRGRFVSARTVAAGFDAADDAIVEEVAAGDVVVTQDILLAQRLVEKGARVTNPRGEIYNAENIGARVSQRNFMEEARGAGLAGGGPPPFDDRDKQAFSNSFDRLLTAALRAVGPR